MIIVIVFVCCIVASYCLWKSMSFDSSVFSTYIGIPINKPKGGSLMWIKRSRVEKMETQIEQLLEIVEKLRYDTAKLYKAADYNYSVVGCGVEREEFKVLKEARETRSRLSLLFDYLKLGIKYIPETSGGYKVVPIKEKKK